MPAPLNVGMTQDNRYVQRSSVFLCRFQTHRQLQRTHKVTFKHKFTPACALFWQCRDKTGKKHRKWWYVPFPCAKTFVFRSLLIMAAAKVRKIAVFWSSLTFWTGFFVFRYKFYSCFSHKNSILPQISTLILRYVEYKVFLRSTARDSSERSDPSKILHKSVGKFHGTHGTSRLRTWSISCCTISCWHVGSSISFTSNDTNSRDMTLSSLSSIKHCKSWMCDIPERSKASRASGSRWVESETYLYQAPHWLHTLFFLTLGKSNGLRPLRSIIDALHTLSVLGFQESGQGILFVPAPARPLANAAKCQTGSKRRLKSSQMHCTMPY